MDTIDQIKSGEFRSIYQENLKSVISLNLIDDHTIEIFLSENDPFFEYKLTFPIMSSAYYGESSFTDEEKNLAPVSTGKFKINELVNNQIKLTYNDYYYVTGTKMVYDYGNSKMREVKDDSYMVCVDKEKRTYRITKIGNPIDYYNNNDIYDRVRINPNEYNDFLKFSDYSEAYVYNNYINYFKDLLFVNYQEAYNMLEDSYKKKVGSLDNFINLREELYNKLNNVVLVFAITGEKFNRTYRMILFNETKITVIENGYMNVKYKIEN